MNPISSRFRFQIISRRGHRTDESADPTALTKPQPETADRTQIAQARKFAGVASIAGTAP